MTMIQEKRIAENNLDEWIENNFLNHGSLSLVKFATTSYN